MKSLFLEVGPYLKDKDKDGLISVVISKDAKEIGIYADGNLIGTATNFCFSSHMPIPDADIPKHKKPIKPPRKGPDPTPTLFNFFNSFADYRNENGISLSELGPKKDSPFTETAYVPPPKKDEPEKIPFKDQPGQPIFDPKNPHPTPGQPNFYKNSKYMMYDKYTVILLSSGCYLVQEYK